MHADADLRQFLETELVRQESIFIHILTETSSFPVSRRSMCGSEIVIVLCVSE